jgi:8-oxo-dGTP diphosphatase
MDFPRVGVAVFIVKNSKFLMQKRFGAHGSNTWSVPGGNLEFGEQIKTAAIREVKEETNLEITNIRILGFTNDIFYASNKHYITIWLLADWLSEQEYIVEPDKCAGQSWNTVSDLPDQLFQPCWNNLMNSDFFEIIRTL